MFQHKSCNIEQLYCNTSLYTDSLKFAQIKTTSLSTPQTASIPLKIIGICREYKWCWCCWCCRCSCTRATKRRLKSSDNRHITSTHMLLIIVGIAVDWIDHCTVFNLHSWCALFHVCGNFLVWIFITSPHWWQRRPKARERCDLLRSARKNDCDDTRTCRPKQHNINAVRTRQAIHKYEQERACVRLEGTAVLGAQTAHTHTTYTSSPFHTLHVCLLRIRAGPRTEECTLDIHIKRVTESYIYMCVCTYLQRLVRNHSDCWCWYRSVIDSAYPS